MIELLAVLGIISLLGALLLPAIQQVREMARRTTCMNNQRNLATALTEYDLTYGRLPSIGNFDAKSPTQFHSWVTSLLPLIDQNNLYQKYNFEKGWKDDDNVDLTKSDIPVLICPDDFTVAPGHGSLSYVVNGGIGWTIPVDCPGSLHVAEDEATVNPIDLNGNGVLCPLDPNQDGDHPDVELMEKTSLFFVENWPVGTGTTRHHELADVQDGYSHTILLTENIRAGYDPDLETTWGSPDPRHVAFFVSGYICKDGKCDEDGIQLAMANNPTDPKAKKEALNSPIKQAEGAAPWPSAQHQGIVAAFCDGSARILNPGMDGKVYFAIVTPQGVRVDGPLAEPGNVNSF